jgi:dienelactone hydrolase
LEWRLGSRPWPARWSAKRQPRQVQRIREQLADWQAAIAYAPTLPGVDPVRLAIWSFSASGGHMFRVAARNPELAAAIAQTPNADGQAAARNAACSACGVKDGPKPLHVRAWRCRRPDHASPAYGRGPRLSVGEPARDQLMHPIQLARISTQEVRGNFQANS